VPATDIMADQTNRLRRSSSGTALAAAALALACAACSYHPPGQCSADADCSAGTLCQDAICTSCPGGLCFHSTTLSSTGGSVRSGTMPYADEPFIQLDAAAGAAPAGTVVSLRGTSCLTLTMPAQALACYGAFDLTTSGSAPLSRPLHLSSSTAPDLPIGAVVVVALVHDDGTWEDVILAIADGFNPLHSLKTTAVLKGITRPGTYVIYKPAPGSVEATLVADFGLALIPDDGALPGSGIQVVSLYDDDGVIKPQPTVRLLSIPSGSDLDGAALTPDGSEGVVVDGGNFVVFFSGISTGRPKLSAVQLDVLSYGGDGDAVVISPDGDEAIVTADGSALVVITGILSGNPQLATTIPLGASEAFDGLVESADGSLLFARLGSSMAVFAIRPVAPFKGPLGGTVTHSYSRLSSLTVSASAGEDGRDGLATDPADPRRAVVVGSAIQLLTGLDTTLPGRGPMQRIAGASFGLAAAITPDGKRVIVGTDTGLAMFTGVDTGSLQQVGTVFTTGSGPGSLAAGVPTLGITLDGLYVVALTPDPSASNGVLQVIPLLPNGFGQPVGTLKGVGVPYNDQLLIH
jgi:hypothetical protein